MFKKLAAAAALSMTVLAGLGGVAAANPVHGPKPTKTIVEIASADGRFTTLLAAVGCADPAVAKALTSGDQYTVFAPTDAAFAKANLTPANVCTAIPKATLTNILLYHVTEGRRFANSVLPRAGRTKTIETLLEDQSFKVSHAGVITTTSGTNATIIIPNIAATNGVIHVIDSVLIPGAPAKEHADHRHQNEDK